MEYEATGSPLRHTLCTREACPTSLPVVVWRSTAGSFTSWNGVQGTEVCGYLLFNQEVLRLQIGDSAYKSCMSNSHNHFCQMLPSTPDLPWMITCNKLLDLLFCTFRFTLLASERQQVLLIVWAQSGNPPYPTTSLSRGPMYDAIHRSTQSSTTKVGRTIILILQMRTQKHTDTLSQAY